MTKKKQHPPRFIEVVLWGDHHEPAQTPWGQPSKERELRPAQILSSGFVSVENGRVAELVRDIADDGSVGSRVHLMKRVIIERVKIPIPPAIWLHVKHWNIKRSATLSPSVMQQLLARRAAPHKQPKRLPKARQRTGRRMFK